MSKIKELKNWLKEEGKKLRALKLETKNHQRKHNGDAWKLQMSLAAAKRDYRHHHIAYSELRGKTRDQIECPRDDNYPDEAEIQRIKEQYAWSPEEIAAYEERKAKREVKTSASSASSASKEEAHAA